MYCILAYIDLWTHKCSHNFQPGYVWVKFEKGVVVLVFIIASFLYMCRNLLPMFMCKTAGAWDTYWAIASLKLKEDNSWKNLCLYKHTKTLAGAFQLMYCLYTLGLLTIFTVLEQTIKSKSSNVYFSTVPTNYYLKRFRREWPKQV